MRDLNRSPGDDLMSGNIDRPATAVHNHEFGPLDEIKLSFVQAANRRSLRLVGQQKVIRI
eukprot:GAFH01004102.1.p3 GENE.GAFH01004102.1~~GAFH01004102.1.p3  ORF type:complete len:60 (+),score=4.77 GAFH01004102.1:254-433(+)